MLLHRHERRAELVPLGDAVGDRYGTALCEIHLGRAKPPTGWTLVNRRDVPPAPVVTPARPRLHGAPGSSTNPAAPVWAPRRGREAPDEITSVRSPLLRRAFLGSSEEDDQDQLEDIDRVPVLGKVDPTAGGSAPAPDQGGAGEASPDEAGVLGAEPDAHPEELADGQLRLAV